MSQVLHRALILLPDRIEENKLLAYCAALQSYASTTVDKVLAWNSIYKGQERMVPDVQMTVCCPEPWAQMVIARIVHPKDIQFSNKPSPKMKEEFDQVWDLRYSQEDAARYAQRMKKHFAQLLGILIGAETQILPSLAGLEYEKTEVVNRDILLSPLMHLWMGKHIARLGPNIGVLSERGSLDAVCSELAACKLLISEPTFESYLASAMGTHVYEVTDKAIGRHFLSKFANKNYLQFMIDTEQVCTEHFMLRLQCQWDNLNGTNTTMRLKRTVTLV